MQKCHVINGNKALGNFTCFQVKGAEKFLIAWGRFRLFLTPVTAVLKTDTTDTKTIYLELC
jgi:hypothetical protein